MDKLFELLLVSGFKGIGKKTIHKKYLEAIKRSNDTEDLISNLLPRIKTIPTSDMENSIEYAKAKMEEIRSASDVEVITIFSDRYPKKLSALGPTAPLILYTKGDLEALYNNCIVTVQNPCLLQDDLSVPSKSSCQSFISADTVLPACANV